MRLQEGVGSIFAVLVVAALSAACGGARPDSEHRLRIVKPGVAFAMMRDYEDLLILDVRPKDEFLSSAGRIDGAVNAPLAVLAELWVKLDMSHEDTVLLYGGDGGAYQREAALFLIERGQRFVVQIEGGLEGWLDADFPVKVEDPVSPVPF